MWREWVGGGDDSFFFLKDRSSLQYFITQGMGRVL